MPEHRASVTVNAPVHQVYEMFTHFNDYPKFMSHVKEVTYYDDERSHWVVDVVGRHEWDAVNESWIEDQQIAWRSIDGLRNSGFVRFSPVGQNQTRVDVTIAYDPPAGAIGDIGEKLGAGKSFEKRLQNDLTEFARMVEQAPQGTLDPESSNYLFHKDSAVSRGKATRAQKDSMTAPGARGTPSSGARREAEAEASSETAAGRSGRMPSADISDDNDLNEDLDRQSAANRLSTDLPNTTSPADES